MIKQFLDRMFIPGLSFALLSGCAGPGILNYEKRDSWAFVDQPLAFNYSQNPKSDLNGLLVSKLITNEDLRSEFQDKTAWFGSAFGRLSSQETAFVLNYRKKIADPGLVNASTIGHEDIDLSINVGILKYEKNQNTFSREYIPVPTLNIHGIFENKFQWKNCTAGSLLVLGVKRFDYRFDLKIKNRPKYLANLNPTLFCISRKNHNIVEVYNFNNPLITGIGSSTISSDGKQLYIAYAEYKKDPFNSKSKIFFDTEITIQTKVVSLDLATQKIDNLFINETQQVMPFYKLTIIEESNRFHFVGADQSFRLVKCVNSEIKKWICTYPQTNLHSIGSIYYEPEHKKLTIGTLFYGIKNTGYGGEVHQAAFTNINDPFNFEKIASGFASITGLATLGGSIIAFEFAPESRKSNQIYKLSSEK